MLIFASFIFPDIQSNGRDPEHLNVHIVLFGNLKVFDVAIIRIFMLQRPSLIIYM
jgi:hypothetical protein